ncbi:hypothetical protein GCM10022380_25270 [Amycolatopsis tucumanensis]|uniref:Uncharacterized protein n=1 Tax=Amycolatopsis tucumanensis TaxID=401106 RepID=A0ABP7I049_9PSEU
MARSPGSAVSGETETCAHAAGGSNNIAAIPARVAMTVRRKCGARNADPFGCHRDGGSRGVAQYCRCSCRGGGTTVNDMSQTVPEKRPMLPVRQIPATSLAAFTQVTASAERNLFFRARLPRVG